ncbi:hypothetical protein GO986_12975 [Deinococcus sp. HMF7620]|uniref:Uncharacterized protein n=1 Tax=Deinococcus arboris TaxID=2682977 RepID=A0A7C9I094_9DEIO|nr:MULTISPECIES: hypothetical protein [Deinococcus]MBZ9750585.1 hypothetical protein [Deinococcus betulae]MVN87675.1 hypothetical protein [Deinococcus arboris]
MNRAARLGGLLALILVVCGVVIALDQNRSATANVGTDPAPSAPTETVPATPSGGSGYGDLK